MLNEILNRIEALQEYLQYRVSGNNIYISIPAVSESLVERELLQWFERNATDYCDCEEYSDYEYFDFDDIEIEIRYTH